MVSTYKEQRDSKKYFVLLKDCNVLGTFGNLKKVCEFMKGKDFYSYHTLVKKEFPVTYKEYKIYKTLLKEKYFSFVKYCDKFYTNTSSISEIKFLNKNCLVPIGNRNKKRVGHELNKKAPELLYKYLKK